MPKRRKYGVLQPATEDEMLEALMELGPSLGYLTYHTHDSRHSPAGYPDVSLIGNGMAVWVELKGEGEKMTPAQERYAERIGDLPHPCWHFLVHPSTYDNLVQRLVTWREEYRHALRDTEPSG